MEPRNWAIAAEKWQTCVYMALAHVASHLDHLCSNWSVWHFLDASPVQFRNAGVVFYEVLPLQWCSLTITYELRANAKVRPWLSYMQQIDCSAEEEKNTCSEISQAFNLILSAHQQSVIRRLEWWWEPVGCETPHSGARVRTRGPFLRDGRAECPAPVDLLPAGEKKKQHKKLRQWFVQSWNFLIKSPFHQTNKRLKLPQRTDWGERLASNYDPPPWRGWGGVGALPGADWQMFNNITTWCSVNDNDKYVFFVPLVLIARSSILLQFWHFEC